MSKQGVKSVIKKFGTQEHFGGMFDVSQQQVNSWVTRGYIPTKYAKDLVLIAQTPVADYVHPDIKCILEAA